MVPLPDNLRDEISDWKFIRTLAKLREVETKIECDQSKNPDLATDGLIPLVKERASLPFAIDACEQLAEVLETLWRKATDPSTRESPYERHVERFAFQIVLCRHNIPREEVEE